MGRRRKKALTLPPRLYEYRGKRATTYYTITPENQRINLGHDLFAAKRGLLDLEVGKSAPGTIGELLDDYLAQVRELVSRGKRAARTPSDNETESVNLKKAFGRMTPEALRPQHVWQYLHKARGRQAPVRANREISFLQAALSWARDQGIVRHNPCIGVKRNEESPRTRRVDDTEFASFLAFARDGKHLAASVASWSDAGKRIAVAAELAYLTGKAQHQVLRLAKSHVSEEGIRFRGRKRGADTLVLWTPALRAVSARAATLRSRVESMYVIYTRDGSPYTDRGFRALWQRLMRAWIDAGKDATADPDERSRNQRFTFHDRRAKAITDVIEAGRRASDLTGHRTESVPARVYDRRVERKAPAVK